ncbi:hypothetical protein ACWF94_24855 [Streptomyces sp. NPDC055078]
MDPNNPSPPDRQDSAGQAESEPSAQERALLSRLEAKAREIKNREGQETRARAFADAADEVARLVADGEHDPDQFVAHLRTMASSWPATPTADRGGRCGNDPRTALTPEDRAAVAEFKEYLATKRRAEKAEKERDGLAAVLHLLRYGLDLGRGRGIFAEYWRDVLDRITAAPGEPCDRDQQYARAQTSEAAIARTVARMQEYADHGSYSRRRATADWLTANGIDPGEILVDSPMTVNTGLDGNRTITYEAVAGVEYGRHVFEQRSAPLVVDPPTWWDAYEGPTREQLAAAVERVRALHREAEEGDGSCIECSADQSVHYPCHTIRALTEPKES